MITARKLRLSTNAEEKNKHHKKPVRAGLSFIFWKGELHWFDKQRKSRSRDWEDSVMYIRACPDSGRKVPLIVPAFSKCKTGTANSILQNVSSLASLLVQSTHVQKFGLSVIVA